MEKTALEEADLNWVRQLAPEGADLKWIYDPIPPLVGSCWGTGLRAGQVGLGEHGPIQLDRFTDPISPKPVFRLHRLLHLRTSSGGILRNQAERENIARS